MYSGREIGNVDLQMGNDCIYQLFIGDRFERVFSSLKSAQEEALARRTTKEELRIELHNAPAPSLIWRYDDNVEAWVKGNT